MTSKSIYTSITPTYLYIKQHSVTGLKYFGKTTKNPYKYSGSGTYWKTHINKHGKEFVKTIWVSGLYYDTSIVEHALHFSIENNIIESNNWANLMLENGLDGGIFTENSKIKYKQTCFKKYGVENPSQSEIIKQKKVNTSNENWGVEYSLQSKIIKEKSKQTLLEKYGVENASQSIKIKQKKKDKAQEKYGVDNVFQSEEIKNRIKQSNLKKYGYENSQQCPEVKEKVKQTKLKNNNGKYKSKEELEKIKQTCLKKYGVDNIAKLPFLSIIKTKKTHSKSVTSKLYPELKQYY